MTQAFRAHEELASTFTAKHFVDVDSGDYGFESRKLRTLRELVRSGFPQKVAELLGQPKSWVFRRASKYSIVRPSGKELTVYDYDVYPDELEAQQTN